METQKLEEVGVVVGRFQVPDIHEGHHSLLEYVLSKHNKVCLVLGVAPTRSTPLNALDYHTRYMMFKDMFKDNTNITVTAIMDMRDDDIWSAKLDEKLEELYNGKTFRLYGSRDSFLSKYAGKHRTETLESEIYISGTAIREDIKDQVISSYEFRCGVIYGANDRFFNPIPAVDIGIVRAKKDKQILLGRKKNESQFRLFGGFVDSSDMSYESAAIRELREEAGINIEIGKLEYLMSWKVDDWRYRNEKQKIFTSLYVAEYLWGTPTPGDDIHELKWFDMHTLKRRDVVDEHHILVGEILKRYSVPFDTDAFDI